MPLGTVVGWRATRPMSRRAAWRRVTRCLAIPSARSESSSHSGTSSGAVATSASCVSEVICACAVRSAPSSPPAAFG
eukprot:5122751-Prymnesium_polylepis.1